MRKRSASNHGQTDLEKRSLSSINSSLRKKARTSNIAKAHANATAALESFGSSNADSISSMKVQDGGVEISDDIPTGINALKAKGDTAERAFCRRSASAHAALLFRILELLRKKKRATVHKNRIY